HLSLSHHTCSCTSLFFSITEPATPDIYTLSLHDALPISLKLVGHKSNRDAIGAEVKLVTAKGQQCATVSTAGSYLSSSDKRVHIDRKSTRLNSSHRTISYAVFCLKKKKKKKNKKNNTKKQ